jgi:hypothetical protein
MPRALCTAVVLALAMCVGSAAQDLQIVRIRVSVLTADQRQVPVGRHVLLISDEPVSATPRRVVTSADGTAEIRLRPGTYVAESDRAFVLDSRAYEWVHPFTVGAGKETTVDLTSTNATVNVAPAGGADVEAPPASASEASVSLLNAWQASVFELWSAHAHASGFLADETGLVVTSLRALEQSGPVEVQLSSTAKVAGVPVVADESTDVAVIRVHPTVVAGLRPVPIACEAASAVSGGTGRDADRYVITAPMFGAKDADSSLTVPATGAGGPVMSADGRAIGLSSPVDDGLRRGVVDVRIVPADRICAALTAARAQPGAAPPDAAHLPVEPPRAAAPAGPTTATGTPILSSHQLTTSDFDVTFLTPALLARVAARRDFTGGRQDDFSGVRVAADFENWTEYVDGAPPLLYVRVTPRLVEGFWMKLARGAASTQGASIPPIKRLRPGFSRMRLVCGGREVTPVHPFRIQAPVSDTEAIEEGFYAFDPEALGPGCGSASIVLSSVKDPDKAETRAIDPAILRQVAADFGR